MTVVSQVCKVWIFGETYQFLPRLYVGIETKIQCLSPDKMVLNILMQLSTCVTPYNDYIITYIQNRHYNTYFDWYNTKNNLCWAAIMAAQYSFSADFITVSHVVPHS